MSTAAVFQSKISVDEYFQFQETNEVRHEYVGGYLYAMVGATRRHHRIIRNITEKLWSRAVDDQCEVFSETMRLRVANDVFYYPDIMVVCDPTDTAEQYASHPCLVVEVLSPNTETKDRRETLVAYRQLESLDAYLIVYQDEMRVERHWRDEHRQWQQEDVGSHESVSLPCPEIVLSVAAMYRGLPDPA